jgi:hypothetical protein
LLSIRYSIPFFESMLNFFLLKEICRSFRWALLFKIK